MSATDVLEPTGPNTSLRGRATPQAPTVYRPADDALPYRVRQGADGHVYGWVRMVPTNTDEARSPAPKTASGVAAPGRDRPSLPSTAERPRLVEDLPGFDQRPDPVHAQTPAEFVHTMRRYLVWSGDWSLRELEQFCGGAVARSTFHTALNATVLPKYVVLVAFVTACVGEDQEESQRWITAWRRIRLASEP